MSLKSRFWSKVNKKGPDECWEWTGSKYINGYGSFNIGNNTIRGAHRIAYTLVKGPIPDNMYICHTCDNKLCCNPNHLYCGTPGDNNMDTVYRNKSFRSGIPSKFTNSDILKIKDLYINGRSQSEIGKLFDVTKQYIGAIIRGERGKNAV